MESDYSNNERVDLEKRPFKGGQLIAAFVSSPVVTQYYEAEVVSEYVIRGNAAILKCTIPSFVAEFVSVDSWVGSDGSTFKPTNDYGTTVSVLCLSSTLLPPPPTTSSPK